MSADRMKLTLWFSFRTQKPIRTRPGEYQAMFDCGPIFRPWWDGNNFRWSENGGVISSFGVMRGDKWRGVAKP